MDIPENIIVHQFLNGPLDNFQYFIGDKNTNEVAMVDPAWDVDLIRSEAEKNGFTITNIFLTHGHPDHVNGLDELLTSHDVPVYISQHEASFLTPKCKNLKKIEDGDTLKVGSVEFECVLVPGHTPGCQYFRNGNAVIVGDAVFVDGCGRCDLPGGDASVMYDTLYNIILKLPDSAIIFPGHDYGPKPYDTIGNQKQTNPYLTCPSREGFLKQRMGLFL